MPVTHSLKAGLIMLSVLCTQGCVINIEENQFEELDFNPQREMMGSFEPSQLTVATWNVEHLAYPINTGCKPRTESDINAMREYVNNVDADVFALQEVASEQAVRLLFPTDTWQVLMSPRPDSETYECRGSGRESTQQKIAYAVKNGININSVKGLSELGLNNPGLRYGLELTIQSELGAIKLLNVHMTSTLGKIITQFRTFMLVSYSKQFLHNIKRNDFAAYSAMMYSTFFAGLSYTAQMRANAIGREDKEEFLKERLSGLFNSSLINYLNICFCTPAIHS